VTPKQAGPQASHQLNPTLEKEKREGQGTGREEFAMELTKFARKY